MYPKPKPDPNPTPDPNPNPNPNQAAIPPPAELTVEGLRALLDGLRPPVQGAVHLSHWEAEWKAHLAAAAVAAPTAEAAGGAG